MNIGLTFDLRSEYIADGYSREETAEFDQEDAIENLEKALQANGYQTEKIGNIKKLMARLLEGKRWDLVFNIAEGMYGVGREAQVPALLDAYNINYTFSDPMILSLTLDKAMTKRVVRDFGINTPNFAVIKNEADLATFHLEFPVFAKPLAEGSSKGIDQSSKVTTMQELQVVCAKLLTTFNQPVLVEEYLPGREFTVGIIGSGDEAKIAGVMEIILLSNAEHNAYSYDNKQHYEGRIKYRMSNDSVSEQCGEMALQVWRALQCKDAGRVDIRLDKESQPGFIEVNPLPGLHYLHSDLPIMCKKVGISFNELIKEIVDSAKKRM